MQPVLDILKAVISNMGPEEEWMLAFLLGFIVLMAVFDLQVRRGRRSVKLRHIPGFDTLRGVVGRATETGRPFHVSAGVRGVGSQATAESLAGLTVLGCLAEQAAICDAQPVVTVANPTMLAAAGDVVRGAYARSGRVARYDPTEVRFVAPDPTAYAAGVMGILGGEGMEANVLVGGFGHEYLLMGEAGSRAGLPQVGGATDPHVLPFVYASADQALIGEEVFAGGAYLSSDPSHIASLLTQDAMRLIISLLVVILVLLRSVS